MMILLHHRQLGECSCGKWTRQLAREYNADGVFYWIAECLDWDGKFDFEPVKEFGECFDDFDLALEVYHRPYDPDEYTHGRSRKSKASAGD